MKQNSLTQAIQDLTQDNPTMNMMDTIFSEIIDKQFNEVFGPSSKCTLGGFWNSEPVAVDPSVFEQFIPTTMSILERLEHDLMIHDQFFQQVIAELEPKPEPKQSYLKTLGASLEPFHQGSRRMYGNTMYLPVVSPFNV